MWGCIRKPAQCVVRGGPAPAYMWGYPSSFSLSNSSALGPCVSALSLSFRNSGSSLVAQWVRVLELSLLWLWFDDPWPRNFCMPRAQQKKKKKLERKESCRCSECCFHKWQRKKRPLSPWKIAQRISPNEVPQESNGHPVQSSRCCHKKGGGRVNTHRDKGRG